MLKNSQHTTPQEFSTQIKQCIPSAKSELLGDNT
jgi:hypothetical protein